jgi:hypothetical protein
MGLRALLVGLIVAATAAFIVGTAVERSSSSESAHHEAAVGSPPRGDSGGETPSTGESGESTGKRAQEGTTTEGHPRTEEIHAEPRPLGIDVEAWPFVALAAMASLALAAAAWRRPRQAPLLGLVAAAMLIFAALDLREVLHQADVDDTGLAILAAVIAALHLGAAGVAGVMASRAWRPGGAAPGTAGPLAA